MIDRECEDEVFAELEKLGAEGASFVAVSEERGEVVFGDGGAARVVIDPIDGSLNARRTIPSHSLSIAVAEGDSMADVRFGFVHDFGADEEFIATRGEGASVRTSDGARGREARVAPATASSKWSAWSRRSPTGPSRPFSRSPATPTASAWSARSRSPPPTSPPAASTPSSACGPAARSTPPRPS